MRSLPFAICARSVAKIRNSGGWPMSPRPAKEKRGYNTALKTDTAAGCAASAHNSIEVKAASTVKRRAASSEGSLPRSTQKTSARAEAHSQKGHYKPLLKEFRRDGFNYRQIA